MDVGISKNQLLHRQLESAIPLLFSPCTLLSQYLLMESLGFPGRFFPLVPPWVSVKVYFHLKFCSVQSFSCVWLFAIPWTAVSQASLSITNYWSLPKPMSIESVMPSNRLILCHPLLLLPSIFPIIRVFSNESALSIRWTKYWSFSFNMDWLDLLAVQEDAQESSPKPQFKSINSLVLSFLYSPTFTPIERSKEHIHTSKWGK